MIGREFPHKLIWIHCIELSKKQQHNSADLGAILSLTQRQH